MKLKLPILVSLTIVSALGLLCAQEKVPASVMAGLLVKKVPIKYPAVARAAHISGDVVLRGVIGRDGKVESLQVVSGEKVLADSTIEAVRQWEYRPYLLNGEPIEVETTITANFAINDRNPKMDKPDKAPSGYKQVSTQALEDLCVRPAMTYPALAKSAGFEGDIALELIVGPDGRVELAKALGGPDMLRADAERFVLSWRCMPARKGNGETYGSHGIVLVKYRLHKSN